MTKTDPHWTFHIEVLTRAVQDLETTCTADPGTAEFKFLRSEAPVILSEAREAISALKKQVYELERRRSNALPSPTEH
ncbi:MAG: hypothetical protein AAFU81_09180 [Pseudomonadota bacterium]